MVFTASHLQILSYNRLVHDLNGMQPEVFLERLELGFEVGPPTDQQVPTQPRSFAMVLDGTWRMLKAKPSVIDENDPVRRLDVAILQDHLLHPILGIDDPRTSSRIRFLGGIRGSQHLADLIAEGEGRVAFSMYATPIQELLDVADAGEVMPPKSTWFEPKLASGLLVHLLD